MFFIPKSMFLQLWYNQVAGVSQAIQFVEIRTTCFNRYESVKRLKAIRTEHYEKRR